MTDISLPERFQIDREIGRGGMAVVYRAHDHHLGRFVAVKVLSAEFSSALGAERFQREIAVMAKLVHPGIVALFDSGIVEGRLYYVMPLMTGETLRARLLRERRLSPSDAAALCADVAEGLAYAHGLGIVHRDVKPENVFAVSGRAILADFGIARLVSGSPLFDRTSDPENQPTHVPTSAGLMLGTVSYMSPEQIDAAPDLDGRADLYSLGCVLYELLTGAPPFTGGSPAAVLAKHLAEAPRPPSDTGMALSPELEALTLQLLAKQPCDRPGTAADVARALRGVELAPSSRRAPAAQGEADRLAALGIEACHRFGGTSGAAAIGHLDESKAYLTRALAIDPLHARALCALGNWHYVAGTAGVTPEAESFAKGRELIFAALAADDRVAEVHCSMCKLALYFDNDFHAADRHIRRAIELDPADAESLRLHSIIYKILGRADRSVEAARLATTRAPHLASLWNTLGDALLAAGRNAEAVDALKKAVALLPGFGPALERLERARMQLGEFDLAVETRGSRLRQAGERERAELLERESREAGPADAIRRDMRRDLDAWLEQAARVDPFKVPIRNLGDRIIGQYVLLGEWRQAIDWLERAFDYRPGRLRRLLAELPVDYHGLAVDPRFAKLMRVAGLADLL